jgi:hypothetical protein
MLITAGPARRFQAALFESAHAHAVFALTRFSPLSNPRPSGSVVDEANGPRKAVDQVCTVAIRLLRPCADVIVVDADADPFEAPRGTTREARTAAERLSASLGPALRPFAPGDGEIALRCPLAASACTCTQTEGSAPLQGAVPPAKSHPAAPESASVSASAHSRAASSCRPCKARISHRPTGPSPARQLAPARYALLTAIQRGFRFTVAPDRRDAPHTGSTGPLAKDPAWRSADRR